MVFLSEFFCLKTRANQMNLFEIGNASYFCIWRNLGTYKRLVNTLTMLQHIIKLDILHCIIEQQMTN